MEISQIVAIAVIGTVLSVTLKNMRPELSVFLAIATGIIIFTGIIGKLSAVLDIINSLAESVSIDSAYISVILKVIGIAYIAEFGMELCRDAGESLIASKIELAGKVLIMAVSAPVIIGVIEMISSVMP